MFRTSKRPQLSLPIPFQAELEPFDSRAEDLRTAELKLEDEEKFSFEAPDALLRPFPANPLRIFVI